MVCQIFPTLADLVLGQGKLPQPKSKPTLLFSEILYSHVQV